MLAGTTPPKPPALGPTLVLFLLLLGTLGVLLLLTLLRWSWNRAGRIERSSRRTAPRESPWSLAGKRAKPADDPDEREPSA